MASPSFGSLPSGYAMTPARTSKTRGEGEEGVDEAGRRMLSLSVTADTAMYADEVVDQEEEEEEEEVEAE